MPTMYADYVVIWGNRVRKYALFGAFAFANMRYFAKNHSQIRLISRFRIRKYTLFGVFRFANELKQYKQK
jgi:predicted nucleotidyltransferase